MPLSDLTPTLDQVAALARHRTVERGTGGNQPQGTFTEHTRPTAGQVTDLAEQGAARVADRVGTTLTGPLLARAQTLAALAAAILVEAGSEDPSRERIAAWREQWEDGIAALDQAAATDPGDGTTDPGGTGLATHTFPPPSNLSIAGW